MKMNKEKQLQFPKIPKAFQIRIGGYVKLLQRLHLNTFNVDFIRPQLSYVQIFSQQISSFQHYCLIYDLKCSSVFTRNLKSYVFALRQDKKTRPLKRKYHKLCQIFNNIRVAMQLKKIKIFLQVFINLWKVVMVQITSYHLKYDKIKNAAKESPLKRIYFFVRKIVKKRGLTYKQLFQLILDIVMVKNPKTPPIHSVKGTHLITKPATVARPYRYGFSKVNTTNTKKYTQRVVPLVKNASLRFFTMSEDTKLFIAQEIIRLRQKSKQLAEHFFLKRQRAELKRLKQLKEKQDKLKRLKREAASKAAMKNTNSNTSGGVVLHRINKKIPIDARDNLLLLSKYSKNLIVKGQKNVNKKSIKVRSNVVPVLPEILLSDKRFQGISAEALLLKSSYAMFKNSEIFVSKKLLKNKFIKSYNFAMPRILDNLQNINHSNSISLHIYNFFKGRRFHRCSKTLVMRFYVIFLKHYVSYLATFLINRLPLFNKSLYSSGKKSFRNAVLFLFDALSLVREYRMPFIYRHSDLRHSFLLKALFSIFNKLIYARSFSFFKALRAAWVRKRRFQNYRLRRQFSKLFSCYKRRKITVILRKRKINRFYKRKLLRKIKSKRYWRISRVKQYVLSIKLIYNTFVRVESYEFRKVTARKKCIKQIYEVSSRDFAVIYTPQRARILAVYNTYIKYRFFKISRVRQIFSVQRLLFRPKKNRILRLGFLREKKYYNTRYYYNNCWPHILKTTLVLGGWSQFLSTTFFDSLNLKQASFFRRCNRKYIRRKYKIFFKKYIAMMRIYYMTIYRFKYLKKVPPHSILKRVRQFEKLRGFKKLPRIFVENALWIKHNKFFDWLKVVRDKKSFFKMKIVLDRLFKWIYHATNINYVFGGYFHKVVLSNYIFQTNFIYKKTHKIQLM